MANPIYGICKKIRVITPEQFQECEVVFNRQAEHIHPLKMKRQAKINGLGENNLKILEHLKAIQKIIEINKP